MKQVFKIEGEGMTLSYLGLQNHLSTTENPLDFGGGKVKIRWHQNEAKQGLRGGKRPQTQKWP